MLTMTMTMSMSARCIVGTRHIGKICTRSKTSGTQWQNHSPHSRMTKMLKKCMIRKQHIFVWILSAHLHRQWSHYTLFVCTMYSVQCIFCPVQSKRLESCFDHSFVHVVPPVLNLEYLFLIFLSLFFAFYSFFYGLLLFILFFGLLLLHNFSVRCNIANVEWWVQYGFDERAGSTYKQPTKHPASSNSMHCTTHLPLFFILYFILLHFIIYIYLYRSQWEYERIVFWTHQTVNILISHFFLS